MSTLTIINNPDGTVEAHRKGCADVARKGKRHFADAFDMDADTKREAFLTYNGDFLDEGTPEDECYPIKFLPCVTLPEGEQEEQEQEEEQEDEEQVEPPMTKTEARAFLKRAREALRWAELCVTAGNADDLNEAMLEAIGAAAHIQDAVQDRGLAGAK